MEIHDLINIKDNKSKSKSNIRITQIGKDGLKNKAQPTQWHTRTKCIITISVTIDWVWIGDQIYSKL